MRRNSYTIRNLTGFNLYWLAHRKARKEEGSEEVEGGEGEEDGEVHLLVDEGQETLGRQFERSGRRGRAAKGRGGSGWGRDFFVSMELEFFLPMAPLGFTFSLFFSFCFFIFLIFFFFFHFFDFFFLFSFF